MLKRIFGLKWELVTDRLRKLRNAVIDKFNSTPKVIRALKSKGREGWNMCYP
jgi:hypothetical protein